MADKIKVGIWGLGRAGINMHAPEIKRYPDLYELVAGMDTDAAHRSFFQEKYGCQTYADADEFLADPRVELVSIATRSTDHTCHALKALAAGKYVFLEKPIAMNYAEAQRLVAADKQYPGRLYLRHNRRFEAAFAHIMEIMGSGVLGDVYEVKLRRLGYQRRNDWQTIIACGGGQLNNWGPHIIDHALCFLGCPVKEIWSDLKKVAAVGDAEDHLKIILKGENGRIVDLEISGGAAIEEPEYVIFGTKGALVGKGNQITLKYLDPEQKLRDISAESGNPPITGGFGNDEQLRWIEKTIEVAPKSGCDVHSIWPEMYRAIRSDAVFAITVEQSAEVVRIIEQVKKNTPFVMK